MQDYSYPSANKRGYSEEVTYFPTAEKSQYRVETETYFDRTPQRNLFGSPTRQTSSLSTAKKSIDECIFMVSDKKKMNQEAINEVEQVNRQILGFNPFGSPTRQANTISETKRSIDRCINMVSDKNKMNQEALHEVGQVNYQILGSFTGYNYNKGNDYEFKNRTEGQHKKDFFRNNVVTSQFDFQPNFTSPRANYKGNLQEQLGNQENVELGSRLNTQIKKNKDLIRHINNLEAELANLKTSKGVNTTNASVSELIEQNRYLRSQLASSPSNVPYNLIEELERLKAENSQLRRDTVTLLKTKKS